MSRTRAQFSSLCALYPLKYHFIRSWWYNPAAVSRKVRWLFLWKVWELIVIQGHAIVAGLLEICKNTENRLKLVEMDNFYICRLQLERIKGIYQFLFKNCKEAVKEHEQSKFISRTQPWSNSHIFGFFFLCNIAPPPLIQDTNYTESFWSIDIHPWYKWR